MARTSKNLTIGGIGVMALVLVTALIFVTRAMLEEAAPRPLDERMLNSRNRNADLTPLAELAVKTDGLIDLKMKRFKLHMGRYPMDLAELTEAPKPLTGTQRWEGPYVSSQDLLRDPWGNLYEYRFVSDDAYELWSCGPDGVSGTGDDVHK
jgi:hypothetical protein